MELREQQAVPTLARRLGDTTHLSPLLRKLQQATGLTDRLPQWLLKTAIARGASHYRREFEPGLPPDNLEFSDEEVAVALCLGHMPDDPTLIRAAAQLLSSPRTDIERLVWLAKAERVERVLFHIAAAGLKVDSTLEPWAALRQRLQPRQPAPPGVLPHWSRFVLQAGFTRAGRRTYLEWLTRDE